MVIVSRRTAFLVSALFASIGSTGVRPAEAHGLHAHELPSVTTPGIAPSVPVDEPAVSPAAAESASPKELGRAGMAALDEARSTEDPSGYSTAELLFMRALALDPTEWMSLVGMGSLALSRHDFAGALYWVERTRAADPVSTPLLANEVDASIELGRYEEARRALEEMVALRPDLPSLSRVSYLRELHGDLEGAIEAMRSAADAGLPGTPEAAWCRTHLADLLLRANRLDEAERELRRVDRERPGDPRALAGLARLADRRGDVATAQRLYETALESYPLAQFRIELGEMLAANGRADEAEAQFALVHAAVAEAREHGMDVDMEMVLFDLEHGGDPEHLLPIAEAVYARRPSVAAAHVLAWTLYRNGRLDEARVRVDDALRLGGGADPLLLWHAGVILGAAGDASTAAPLLANARAMDPRLD